MLGVAERLIPLGVRERERELFWSWLKGEERKREAKVCCWDFGLRLNEKLTLFSVFQEICELLYKPSIKSVILVQRVVL